MFCINLESTDPFFNLAIEEILLKERKDEYLILGVNTPSVIIGKHQSAHMEINTKFVTENGIPVIRRISGGGTVFHDMGNLNFTFIRKSETGKQLAFREYTKPVIEFLLSMGIEAKFEGKNDIKVGGLKISGNAEHVHRNRVLHHGTLLFSSSLEMLGNSIRNDKSCYSSRSVGSNPSSVINLNKMLESFQSVYELRREMMNYLMKILPGTLDYKLSQAESDQAEMLALSKYRTWEWVWAYGTEYHFVNRFEINRNPCSCHMFVKDGIIRECEIKGSKELVSFSSSMIGCRHMVSDLKEVFRNGNIRLNDVDIYKFF